jgi:hypothetical protein
MRLRRKDRKKTKTRKPSLNGSLFRHLRKKKKQNVLKIVFVVLLLVYESEQAP